MKAYPPGGPSKGGALPIGWGLFAPAPEKVPAEVDEAGVVRLPHAPFHPVPLATAGALLVAGIALGTGYVEERLRE